MAHEDIGGALGRFNETLSHNEPEGDEGKEPKDAKGSKGKGHIHTIHVHKDGSYHHTVHHGGQMIHHSEHPSLDEAADSVKSFAAEEHGDTIE